MPKDYDVGYGKPPQQSQFKKGQSGNPYGRPKRRKKEPPHDPSSILAAPVMVRTPQGTVEMPALEASLRKLVQEALKTTSARKLLKVIDRFDKPGLVRRPNHTKHWSVLNIPRRFDGKTYRELFQKNGPPPWDGPDDGLTMDQSQTHPLSEYRRQHGGEE